jgi:hypothetical protein
MNASFASQITNLKKEVQQLHCQKQDTRSAERWFIVRNNGKPLHRCTAQQINRGELTMDITEGDRSFYEILQSQSTSPADQAKVFRRTVQNCTLSVIYYRNCIPWNASYGD